MSQKTLCQIFLSPGNTNKCKLFHILSGFVGFLEYILEHWLRVRHFFKDIMKSRIDQVRNQVPNPGISDQFLPQFGRRNTSAMFLICSFFSIEFSCLFPGKGQCGLRLDYLKVPSLNHLFDTVNCNFF